MSEKNKRIVRRFFDEVLNQGKLALLDQFLASDFIFHTSAPEEVFGLEGARQYISVYRTAFPDLHFTIEDQIAERDRVVIRWTARGTHKGEFQGIPPTGKQGRVTGISIDRLADGKIVESWENSDELGILQQLGVVPAPGPEEAG